MSGLDAMLATARSQVGYNEHAGGWTKYGDWYATRHHDQAYATADWCDAGVSWCGWKSGNGDVVGEHAYTEEHVNWFKARGQWGSRPRVGALVFFDWPGTPKGANHVGLVVGVRRDGTIDTIEWNHNNACEEVHRTEPSWVYGYGYPAYVNAPTPQTADEDCWIAS
jgi:hypothetical protein